MRCVRSGDIFEHGRGDVVGGMRAVRDRNLFDSVRRSVPALRCRKLFLGCIVNKLLALFSGFLCWIAGIERLRGVLCG